MLQASVFPLLARDDMNRVAQTLSTQLSTVGIFNMIDTTGDAGSYAAGSVPCTSCLIVKSLKCRQHHWQEVCKDRRDWRALWHHH